MAENGSIAVEKIKKSQPGEYVLVLMDIQMPVMDGWQATRAIRNLEISALADIPIIALSANAFESDKRASMESGMDAHLEKSMDEIVKSGFDQYYVDHTIGVWPQASSGMPFSASQFQVTGDVVTDLMEDMAAEQKARTTYDNILRLIKEPDVCEPIKFLRMREIVHFQRFGEALRIVQDKLNSKNFYAFNPGFDRCEDCDDKPDCGCSN